MSLTANIVGMTIAACIIIWGAFRELTVKPINPKYILPLKTMRKQRSKVKIKKPVMNEVQKAAKVQLQSFGFSATEAKKMLEGINASTIEQYVQEAMRRVEV
jgi:hypothetical protein